MDAISRAVLERLRQGGETRAAEIAARVRPPTTTAARIGLPFAPGDRVFDTVSGSIGIVEASPIALNADLALVYVRTDAGGLLVRGASQLVARPTPPAGRT